MASTKYWDGTQWVVAGGGGTDIMDGIPLFAVNGGNISSSTPKIILDVTGKGVINSINVGVYTKAIKLVVEVDGNIIIDNEIEDFVVSEDARVDVSIPCAINFLTTAKVYLTSSSIAGMRCAVQYTLF